MHTRTPQGAALQLALSGASHYLDTVLTHTCRIIDDRFGPEYAKKNPYFTAEMSKLFSASLVALVDKNVPPKERPEPLPPSGPGKDRSVF